MVSLQLKHQTSNQNLIIMWEKIAKNNNIMAAVSILTLAIVAWVLVYKPWKASQKNA
ncbi:MAG: hypothetical protein AUK64_177 [bacterium P201]|nr:MAG: hypothetical protein AUK64_177 [bacterium P201]